MKVYQYTVVWVDFESATLRHGILEDLNQVFRETTLAQSLVRLNVMGILHDGAVIKTDNGYLGIPASEIKRVEVSLIDEEEQKE